MAPTAAARTVAVPAATPAPATETDNLPLASVVPEEGVSVTVAPPVWVSVTVAPGMAVPPASLAVTVMVTGLAPLDCNDPLVAETASVEPTICTGSKAEAEPAVAVMVAVRLALLAVPDEKVSVALPVLSVVTVDTESRPVSVTSVTTAPATDELVVLTAATVIKLVVEPSDLTVVGVPDI